MKVLSLDKSILYDGSQLRPHWIYETTGTLGDTMVAFSGGCSISLAHMVDMEDKRVEKKIYSEDMLHFIFESFHFSLREMILWQHLFASTLVEILSLEKDGFRIERKGNDVFVNEKKFSISVATASPVSSLLHFGINITSHNTPVPTTSIRDLGMEPAVLREELFNRLKQEYDIVEKALYKVKPV